MTQRNQTSEIEALRAQNERLRLQLEEARGALEAMRQGRAEPLVVDTHDGPAGSSLEPGVELTEHEQELDEVLASMAESLLVFDLDGRIVRANAAATNALGFDPSGLDRAELARRTVLTWPDGRALALDETPSVRALRGEVVRGVRLRLDRDGTELAFSVSASLLRTDGRVTGAVSVWHDITEIERARTALQDSQDRLRSVLDHSLDVAYRRDLLLGRFDYLSPAAESLTGFSVEELRAMTPRQAFARIHPEDRAALAAAIKEAERTGRLTAEYRFEGKDGEYRWIADHALIVRDEAGRLRHRTGALRDVSASKRAQEALRSSEAKYRALFENLADAAFLTVPDGTIHAANPAACQMFGMTEEEIVRAGRDALLDGADPRHAAALRERTLTGQLTNVELTCVRKNGERFPGEVSSVILPGEPPRAFVLIRDITKRKRDEEALRASEDRFRTMANAMPQLAWVAGADGYVQWFNDRWYEYTGTTPAQMEGWGWRSVHDPEALPEVLERWNASLASGEPFDMVLRLRGADGRLRPFLTRVLPLEGPGGRIEQWFGTNTDVSELEEMREALRLAEQRFRLALRNAPVSIGAQDLDLRYIWAFNQRTATSGEIVDHTDHDLFSGEEADHITARKRRVIAEGVELREQMWLTRPSGRIFVDVCWEPIRDETDRVVGVASATVDLTAVKRAEEALLAADRRKTEFLSMLSHELRNPLAPIRNSVYVLDRAAPGGEQARRAVAVIDRQVQHMTRLIDDLLDVTRISRGKIRLQRERVELRGLLRRSVEDYRGVFARSGIELDVEVGGRDVFVNADETRISQVVGNLLGNAAKFTPRGGRVVLSLERVGGSAVIRVRDNGSGIPPELLDELFEPFVQADRTLDRSSGGLGLGLSLVKGLVELHGGKVSVRSGGIGMGAEFEVRLPMETSRRADPDSPPRPVLAHRLRVLVIEDNTDAAESLREVLELTGQLVATASTGPEGVRAAKAFEPDVVLCDIGLPELDGFAVAKALREDPELGKARLVALTGYAGADDVRKSLAAGFDEHLAKPPDFRLLEALLAEVAARKVVPVVDDVATRVGDDAPPGPRGERDAVERGERRSRPR